MVVFKDPLIHPHFFPPSTLNLQWDWAEQMTSQANKALTSFFPLLPTCSPSPSPSPAATWRFGAEDARALTVRLRLACGEESRDG